MTTRRRTASLLVLAGIVMGIAGIQGLLAPVSAYTEKQQFVLAPESFGPQSGLAWIAPFEAEGFPASGPGQVSALVMYEDDAPLPRRDNHKFIRDQGGGSFSHWGTKVYLSTSDGSDPRDNGRTYRLVERHAEASALRAAVGYIAAAGAVLALVGLLMAPGLRNGTVVAAAVLAAYASVSLNVPMTSMRRAVAVAGEQAAAQQVHTVRDVARVGNVTYLEPSAFESLRPLPPPRPAMTLELTTEGTTENGVLRMDGKTGRITGTLPGELRAARLAEVLVAGVIAEGTRLTLDVSRTDNVVKTTSFEIPVQPSPERQVLRVVRPLGLYNGGSKSEVVSVTLRGVSGESALCRIDSMTLVDEFEMYRAEGSGEERFQVERTARPAVWQSVPGSFQVPAAGAVGDLLKGSLALRHPDHTLVANVRLEAESADGVTRVLDERVVSAGEGWHDFRLALGGPRPAALRLVCEQLPEGSVLAWAGLRLVDSSRPPQRVLITLMDTLRADMLQPYSSDAPPTPNLQAVANDGVVFENCISQCYWTRPSMTSLMSARYVQAAGVHSTQQRLPAAYPTVAEAFVDAGFYTVGTMSNSNAASDAGLERGWMETTERWVSKELTECDVYIRSLVEPRIEGLMEEDLVVYLHLMDAHGPYGPAEKPEGWVLPPGNRLEFDSTLDRPWNPEPTDASRVALYRDDVSRMDGGWGAFVGRTLDRWETGEGPDTILAVLSDHGEYLGEHGQWSHGYYGMFPEVVHVPLILRAPGKLPRGARFPGQVQNVDVGPTLLELAGVELPVASGWDGQSLLPAVLGGAHDRPALTSAGPSAALFAIYSEHGALLGNGNELENIIEAGGLHAAGSRLDDERSAVEQWLQSTVESGFRDTWTLYRQQGNAVRDALWSDVNQTASVIDPDAIRQLEEMGYLAR
jgi:hypothetical protein